MTTEIDQDPNWEYTTKAGDVAHRRQRAESAIGREPRPTISRDSPVDGGVYEGSYGGEAIVVDSKKESNLINAAYGKVFEAISPDGLPDKNLALNAVFDYVSINMPYSMDGVEAIFQQYASGVDHRKLSLDIYIYEKTGVCRHQALFAGVLLEKMAKDGILRGRVSVDRNMNRRPEGGDKYDGHAWVRYTNSRGVVYILDVAQQVLAPLSELMSRRKDGESVWDYARPEDRWPDFGDKALTSTGISGRKHRKGSLVEFGDDGLIKLPEWLR